MRDIPVRQGVGVDSGAFAALASVLRTHATLQDVLDWCRKQSPPRDLADVIVQDEFTHDVVLDLGGGLAAVYDST